MTPAHDDALKAGEALKAKKAEADAELARLKTLYDDVAAKIAPLEAEQRTIEAAMDARKAWLAKAAAVLAG